MKILVIKLIEFYQRFISPHKGFRCAHLAVHGGDSCSQAIKLIIANKGVIAGWRPAKGRLAACRIAYQTLEYDRDSKKRDKRKRNNYVDCPNPCEVLDCLPIRSCGGKAKPDLDCDLPCGDCSP